ncbi:hypothetical protein ACQ4M3_18385 [Leptolyngbya sp. AN03gr2]
MQNLRGITHANGAVKSCGIDAEDITFRKAIAFDLMIDRAF